MIMPKELLQKLYSLANEGRDVDKEKSCGDGREGERRWRVSDPEELSCEITRFAAKIDRIWGERKGGGREGVERGKMERMRDR